MSVGWKLGGLLGFPGPPLALLPFLPGQFDNLYVTKCELYTNFTGGDLPNRRCSHPC